jgi:hypothetical protein
MGILKKNNNQIKGCRECNKKESSTYAPVSFILPQPHDTDVQPYISIFLNKVREATGI